MKLENDVLIKYLIYALTDMEKGFINDLYLNYKLNKEQIILLELFSDFMDEYIMILKK